MNNNVFMNILINKVEYQCYHFKEFKEHLEVAIKGVIRENNLNIDYEGKYFYGYKLIPTVKDGYTSFKVYIYQDGDKELEVNGR